MVDLAIFTAPRHASPAVEVNNPTQLVAYWHAAFGFPTKSSFIKNIRNGNILVDKLTAISVGKYFTPSPFTAYGHLDATRSNVKSTKRITRAKSTVEYMRPLIWTDVLESKGRLHSDQTGQLPVLGRHNEKYIAIFFDDSTNYIHAETMCDKSAASLLSATSKAISFFAQHGTVTSELRLDNEISTEVRNYLATNHIKVDLTPVGQHRRNKAERSIRTYKNHHIANLAGVDPDCPLELWPDFIN